MTPGSETSERKIGRIPVKNLWLLMLYASDLARMRGPFNALLDESIDDIPDLVARLLADSVERRFRRNLSRGYVRTEGILNRVRGRIDMLATETRQLISKGQVACSYELHTNDIPRNRLVLAALLAMARVASDGSVRHRCSALALALQRSGVHSSCPSRADLSREQVGRNDSEDKLMVALARLAFDLALPTEEAGTSAFAESEREEALVRRLFEKAVLGFARAELEPAGWSVSGSGPLRWQIQSASAGMNALLPVMVTDIVLDSPARAGRLVIDTKFASILTTGRFEQLGLKSQHLYQIYAYLRSQEGTDSLWDSADGLLLYPAIESHVYEHVSIQGHRITFATVNLNMPATRIREELRDILMRPSRVGMCL